MRVLASIVVLCSLATVAHAGDEDDDDAAFAPNPTHSWALGLLGHGSRINGKPESGLGPQLEFAIGRGRWEYGAEFVLASTSLDRETSPDASPSRGKLVHGALNVRWTARQFQPDSSGGVELFLLSMLGAEQFYFRDGGRLARPELGLGFGLHIRMFKRPYIGLRVDARAVFTSSSHDHEVVDCRSRCAMESAASTGFISGASLTW